MRIKLEYLSFFLVGALCLALSSCKTREEATQTAQKRLNEKEAKELLFSKSVIPFYCFYSKIDIDYSDKNRSNSFKATVKMKVDSAFAGTLSVGPIIGASYLVSTDSIIYTDKLNKCFFRENFDYLTAIFGTEIAYEFFQSLVLGLPIGLVQDIKYNFKSTRDYYILSSYKRRDLRRIEGDEEDNIFIQYYLGTGSHTLDRIEIQVPSDTVDISIDYSYRVAPFEDFMLPENTLIKIVHPKDSITINMKHGSVKYNECKEIDINIPDSYVKCKQN